eukprot:6185886-Pleurochrysis_carterae.AAC.1
MHLEIAMLQRMPSGRKVCALRQTASLSARCTAHTHAKVAQHAYVPTHLSTMPAHERREYPILCQRLLAATISTVSAIEFAIMAVVLQRSPSIADMISLVAFNVGFNAPVRAPATQMKVASSEFCYGLPGALPPVGNFDPLNLLEGSMLLACGSDVAAALAHCFVFVVSCAGEDVARGRADARPRQHAR